jgi:peptidoglycan/LPS O-acetylase OafA/YrhL
MLGLQSLDLLRHRAAVGFRYRSPLLKREMPGLDALRGLAVLGVVLNHGMYADQWQIPPTHSLAAHIGKLLRLGWLGVFLFFVLSGFLITGILLDSKDHPNYWHNFYLRRVLRIMPAFALVLLILKFFFGSTWAYVAVCLAYLANIAPMMSLGGALYEPLWSLAVEEQFYLVWPWMARFLTLRRFAYVTLACILVSPILRFLSAKGAVTLGNPHRMTWLLADSLAMGALLAILLRSRWGSVERVQLIAWAMFGVGSALFLAGIPLGILNGQGLLGAAFETVPFELVFAALILFSLHVGDLKAVLIWTRPLRFLGYISYGLYLYHRLVFMSVDGVLKSFAYFKTWSTAEWALRFFGEVSLSVLAAYLSRRYFEEFFLALKARLTPSRSRRVPMARQSAVR